MSSPPSVDVVGYLRELKGIGEAGRLYAVALEAAGVTVRRGAIDAGHTAVVEAGHGEVDSLRGRADASLLCLNAPELERAIEAGVRLPRARRWIGHWAWEVDPAPASWASAADAIDEVWANSTFVAGLLAPLLPIPVVTVPVPVLEPALTGPPDPRTAEGFSFLFLFDFHSMVQRKNPLGLIEAFSRAFAPGEGPHLVLKAANGRSRPGVLAAIRAAAAERPDVELIDEALDRDARDALLAGAGCYVSLHRAEGLGLTIAEAMALGKPVIATGYSGNLDFTTPENSHLVDWRPVPVASDDEVYPAGSTWAEPDLDHAAALMRQVYEQPEAARALGARGREEIRAQRSPEVVGRLALERLDEVLRAPRRRRGGLRRLVGR